MNAMEPTDETKHPLEIGYLQGLFQGLSETFVIREVIALQKMDFNVSVFALKREKSHLLEKSLSGEETSKRCIYARPDHTIQHIWINVKSLFRHPLRYLKTLWPFLKEAKYVEPPVFARLIYHFFSGIGFAGEVHRRGIRHIHAHFSSGTHMALTIHRFTGVPFSFTAHASSDIFDKPVMLDEKLRRAAFVVAVCDYSKKYLDAVTGYRYSDKIHRIYNGIDPAEARSLLGDLGAKGLLTRRHPKEVRIVSVGRLIGCKGFATLIGACRILKERGHRFSCRIVGDGPQRKVLEKLINKQGLAHTVEITGYLPLHGIYRALAEADIFSLLSEIHINGFRDGFPTVILEAMTMSLPVVSTWISGIPEMVLDGRTGLLVHERDEESAANAIEDLIVNEEKRIEFGRSGRQRVMTRFHLEQSMTQLSERFRQSTRGRDHV